MATFIVESYLSGRVRSEPEDTISNVATEADALAATGVPVRYVRMIFIPEDETCLFLFDAESEEVVRIVARRAGLDPVRIATGRTMDR